MQAWFYNPCPSAFPGLLRASLAWNWEHAFRSTTSPQRIPYYIVLSKIHGLCLCFKPRNLHAHVYTFVLDFQTNLLVLQLLCNPVVQSVFPRVLYYVGQDDRISPPCLWSGLLPALMDFTLDDPLKNLFPLVFSTDITGFHPLFPTGSMSAFFNYMKVTESSGPTTFLRLPLKERLIVLTSIQ